MKKDGNEALRGYLATGKAPEMATAVVQDAGFMVATTGQSDPMKELMQNMAAVCMAAKDLHYKAKGKPFLANHELADMIADLDKNRDSINEIYYMGEKQTNPPISYEIVGGAARLVQENYGGNPSPEEDALLGVLHSLCAKVSDQVEQIKQTSGIKSGTQAVLDEISKDALQYAGFLKRVLTDVATKTDAETSITVERV